MLLVGDAILSLTICFSMCDVWSSENVIQRTYTPFIIIAHYGVWLLVEVGFCWPIEFNYAT
jgi:hypothetical protein